MLKRKVVQQQVRNNDMETTLWATKPDNKRMDNEAFNTESVLNVQQNIGKFNIISDDDLDK